MNKKIAIVTGGLGAIGSTTCRVLAQSGHTVIAADLASAKARWPALQATLGNLDIHFEPVDVSDFGQCGEFIKRVNTHYGPVSVLINNAGITRDGVLKKMELADWEAVIAVNLNSVFNLCRQVVDGMCERGHGRSRPRR